MNLNQIRERRAQKVAEARAIAEAAQSQGRQMTPEEIQAFDTIKAAIQGLEAEEARAVFLDDMERRATGVAVDRSHQQLEGRVNVLDVLRAGMEGRSLSGAAAEYHAEAERRTGRKAQGFFVPLHAIEKRAAVDTSMAGAIVPTDHRAQDYIEPFRNSLLARKLGVRVLSGLSGNVSIPKHGTGTTVGWVAEGGTLPDGEFEPVNVSLAPKHAGGLIELSRQLIQQSSPDANRLVTDDLSALLAQAIDSAIIKGGGTNEPVGILSAAGVQTGNLATLGWAGVLALFEKLELANVTPNAILANPKVKTKLAAALKASAAGSGFLWENGKVNDVAAHATNQVVNAAADKGSLILGDFSQALLGIWSEVDILVNPYAEGPYSRGGVLVRAMSTVDVALRHPEAFLKVQDVAI